MSLKTVRPDESDIRFAMDGRLPQRAVVQQVFRILGEEGIIPLLRRLGTFSVRDVLTACESELGYLLNDSGRSRTVRTMLELLAESGVIAKTGDRCVFGSDTMLHETFDDREAAILHAAFAGQMAFFAVCADQFPSFCAENPARSGLMQMQRRSGNSFSKTKSMLMHGRCSSGFSVADIANLFACSISVAEPARVRR